MENKTVNTEMWSHNFDGHGGNSIENNDSQICFVRNTEHAELIVTAVNACRAINPGNPLKVAIGMERLFKVLENVTNNKKLPLNLCIELTSIIDTLKSEF